MEKSNSKIYMLMTISTVFWAGAFIAGKAGIREFSPLALTFFRFMIAAVLIFAVMVKYETKDWRLKPKDWPTVLALGVIGMIGYHLLFFTALKYTSATNASILAATNPLMTALMAAVFAGESIGSKRLSTILLAFLGVVLTISDWDMSVLWNFQFNHGDLIMVAAVFCWAIYSVISKRAMPRFSPLILSTYSFLVCALGLLPFVLLETPVTPYGQVSMVGWGAVIFMAVFPTFIGYLVQQISIKAIGAGRTMIFVNLVPVFSIGMAVVILGEPFSWLKLVSAALIIVGVYWSNKLGEQRE